MHPNAVDADRVSQFFLCSWFWANGCRQMQDSHIFSRPHGTIPGHQSFTKQVNLTNIQLYINGKQKKVQFPTENVMIIQSYQNWLIKKRQYFCKHALSSILSRSHKEGKSLNGRFTVHCRLFGIEVKLRFDKYIIFHIYNISRYGWKSKRGTEELNDSFGLP